MPDFRGTFRRVGNALVPANALAEEDLRRIPEGKEAVITGGTRRNPAQHNLAWALASVVAECVDGCLDADDGMDLLCLKARHCEWLLHPATGKLAYRRKSVAFAAMDQQSFDALFKRFVHVIVTEIVPGLEDSAMKTRLCELVDGDLGRRKSEHDRRFGHETDSLASNAGTAA